MGRPRRFVILLGAAAVAAAAVRHRRAASGHKVPGGILIGDAAAYDQMSRLLLGSFFGDTRAAQVAAEARLEETGMLRRTIGAGPTGSRSSPLC